MKKIALVVIILTAMGGAYWLLSPLFFDKEIDEAFPGEEQVELSEEANKPFVQLPTEEELAKMSDEAKDAIERSIVERMQDIDSEVVMESMDEMTQESSEPNLLAQGSFRDGDDFHKGSGQAKLYELTDGSKVLRLEDFEVTNGPDLFVYLVGEENPQTDEEVENDFVNIGRLKGNKGNQNYEIPGDVNLENYESVVIWCRAFSVLFSTASLQEFN